jgi:hypothetical protein
MLSSFLSYILGKGTFSPVDKMGLARFAHSILALAVGLQTLTSSPHPLRGLGVAVTKRGNTGCPKRELLWTLTGDHTTCTCVGVPTSAFKLVN